MNYHTITKNALKDVERYLFVAQAIRQNSVNEWAQSFAYTLKQDAENLRSMLCGALTSPSVQESFEEAENFRISVIVNGHLKRGRKLGLIAPRRDVITIAA